MSLPVVVPGSCCPVPGLAPLSQTAAAGTATGSLSAAAADLPLPPSRSRGCRPSLSPHRNPRPAAHSVASAAGVNLPSPPRPLLWLGLLQVVLGCTLVALNFVAQSLSGAQQVKKACPFWVGSSVILSGILGLTTWKRSIVHLDNLFVALSVTCVLLSLSGFILGYQGIRFVSSVPRCDLVDMGEKKICFCCEEFHLTKCTEEEAVLTLYHLKSCSASHLLLKKVISALCALNAFTITVCLVAATLRCLQNFATRSCIGESQAEDQDHALDLDDFVPPVPPPSYFSTFNSFTPRVTWRMLGSDVIPLPHIYGSRIKGIEVFCPLEPPPPYEAVQSENSSEQESALQIHVMEVAGDLEEVSDREASQGEEMPEPSSRVSRSPSNASWVLADRAGGRAFNPLMKRSNSDSLLYCRLLQEAVPSYEAATQTEVKPPLSAVTLRNSLRERPLRGRPRSLIDYKSYTDTKQLVAWILEQSSCSMSPDIHELVENIKSVLKSDEKHMAEAITSATFLEQMLSPAHQAMPLNVHALLPRQHPGLLHLESCGDLSTFTTDKDELNNRGIRKAEREQPHSVIGVVRETVL
ncbi:LOW QUALITY PROTEIN: endosomal transmembrane epsin interactor 1 [Pezoporus flaviventris]|uniref:LOW QUALITY PROTEIN: endosomal transmembrane epsin interactor 1 n=1 Tax=Pezoporus flaviventris TaxID=889875 RepID=UPI002AB1E6BC|nr:LOW QUALITY PROTEIN: endosomal transmembrane epsin interactor 1 [Pezoporus flaviventris]